MALVWGPSLRWELFFIIASILAAVALRAITKLALQNRGFVPENSNELLLSSQRHALDYPGCVSFVAFPSRVRAERDEARLKRKLGRRADPEDKRELGGTHGFLVITRMDKRTLGFVWIVLAHLRAQAEEKQAARNMEPALLLLASAGRGFLPFGSAGGALRMVACTRCSNEPCRGMDRRSTDRRRRGRRVVGPLASWRQLERSRHPQRGARADSHRTVPHHPPPDLHGNSARALWDRGRQGGNARIARGAHCLAVVLLEGAPRRVLSHTRVRRKVSSTCEADRDVSAEDC